MSELEKYEAKLGRVYIDFYKKDVGFLSTYNKTLLSSFEKNNLERDERAIRRIIYDVYTFNVKV